MHALMNNREGMGLYNEPKWNGILSTRICEHLYGGVISYQNDKKDRFYGCKFIGSSPEFDKHKIILLPQQGHSQREINKQAGYSGCGIYTVIKKTEESGEVKDKKKRTGRPKETFKF